MRIATIYTGDDGESHFGELDVPLTAEGPVGSLSKAFPVTGLIFREVSGDYDLDFHNAPRRQFVINLAGGVEIQVGDGTVRRFGTGEMFLAEDVTGRGHISRAIDKQPRTSLFVTLD